MNLVRRQERGVPTLVGPTSGCKLSGAMRSRDESRDSQHPEALDQDRHAGRPMPVAGSGRVLALQRSVGNRSLSARLARDPDTPVPEENAKVRALAAVRFQTASSNGGCARCLAIGAPIAPRPRKATRVIPAI